MKKCIYKNIQLWMLENEKTGPELSKLMGIKYNTLWNYLTGATPIKIDAIRKIIELTGMSFEVAFKTDVDIMSEGRQATNEG